jgi:hypothetical protein
VPEGAEALDAARRRAEDAGWGFALVVQQEGPCVESLESDGTARTIPRFEHRNAARAALQQVP